MTVSPPTAIASSIPWHTLSTDEVVTRLGVDIRLGLTSAQARERLLANGPNVLQQAPPPSPWRIFAAQFGSLVIWVLIGAALLSAALGETADAVAIIAIVLVNALIGFFQEYRAELAVEALARMTSPRARVLRDGRSDVIPADGVVPGDVLLLEGGDLVSADARLIEASGLRMDEAPLTGESVPVSKSEQRLPPESLLAERFNTVFAGTSVSAGTGRALVVATGMDTEVGRIADLLATATGTETPLQMRLNRVARHLLLASLAVVIVFALLGWWRGNDALELMLGAVSLAVAAIPEGLPAVVTVALALGVQRMSRRNALVRRLPAVETLGCAEVICTDKTGTLTVGAMTVRRVVSFEKVYSLTGEGYTPVGEIHSGGATLVSGDDPVLDELFRAASLCNDAELQPRDGGTGIVGDPTEAALLVAAAKAGIDRSAMDRRWPRGGTIPFDSERKRMTVACGGNDGTWIFVKGAPETVLSRCDRVLTAHGAVELDASGRARMEQAARMLAQDALRVLAIAERESAGEPMTLANADAVESRLTLLGLVAMQDPPRPEARAAVTRCRGAGVRTVMITGDHPDTARTIARELGILGATDEVLTGPEIAALDDRALAARVADVAVYARVTPEDKLRIVRAWKACGAVVAMTGDGVNDAPAIKEASIGIAMGRTGTEVTKEASDIIITDDNFASIVAAMEEGRGIYDNIRKTLGYLLAGNAAELSVMLAATLAGWPLPLLALHLLWINLVTDGLPALALATDPIDRDVLSRPPRRPDAQLLDRHFLAETFLAGALTAAVGLAAFAWEYTRAGSLDQARDAAFTALVFAELLRSFGARSATRPVWEVGILSNARLFGIVAASIALQIGIHHIAYLRGLFGIGAVTGWQCLAWAVLGVVPLAVLESIKVAKRRWARSSSPGVASGAAA